MILNGHNPWISVSGSGDTRTIQHGGPGTWQDEDADIDSIHVSGGNENAGGASLSWTPGRIRRDAFGHVTAMVPVPEEADSLHVPQELGDLADVGGSPSEGDVLVYANGQWSPAQPVAVEVVTDVSLSGGELTQTKREVRVLPDVGAEQDSKIADVESC
ncbi:hypothetical protein ACERK3_11055 [Phycisphaerales bacterium AB-hyl4]|uniref:Uncharacterized protein n=1 Tax=Natronomicrosphaera hydrolytica TaxID=3242702 RepID=A0ABV4U5G2_9BACT